MPTVAAHIDAARGLTARADAAYARVIARGGLNLHTAAAAAGAARLRLNRGDPAAAWRRLTDPLDHLGFLDRKESWALSWDLVSTAVETLLTLDRPDRAQQLCERHAAATEGRNAPAAPVEQQLCRGLLLHTTDPDAATAAFDQAAQEWKRIGRPYHAALAAERAARTCGDRTETGARLVEPIAVFERLGATSDAARCHHLLRESGGKTPNPRGRAGYGNRLSPREEQIRDLLATGATNKASPPPCSSRNAPSRTTSPASSPNSSRADLTDGAV
ncbi:hypothetical protein [Kitasatospora sp. NPDC002965]|uniref:hypothetical protein n=1 Tax=Kitasatospora sp. NPDC002965 TaxID=3154775 RepID=UPI0033AC4D5A